MSIKKRIEKLEAKANPPKPPEFHVYLTGEDGLLYRHNAAGELVETLSRTEFDALPGRHIHIEPKDNRDE